MNLQKESFDLQGMTVKDIDGSKVGDVSGYYYDGPTGQVEWLVVEGGLGGDKSVLVPVDGLFQEGEDLVTPHTKGHVIDEPAVDGETIDLETEISLYAHFNVRRQLPGRKEDEAPWKQDDAVAKSHRLRAGKVSAAGSPEKER
jgi:sporulation protein YlmC with PRC-barrel domain